MNNQPSRNSPDSLTRKLAEMSNHDVDPERGEQIRQSVHQILNEYRVPAGLNQPDHIIHRLVEPLLATSLSAGYLAWAVNRVLALWNL